MIWWVGPNVNTVSLCVGMKGILPFDYINFFSVYTMTKSEKLLSFDTPSPPPSPPSSSSFSSFPLFLLHYTNPSVSIISTFLFKINYPLYTLFIHMFLVSIHTHTHTHMCVTRPLYTFFFFKCLLSFPFNPLLLLFLCI